MPYFGVTIRCNMTSWRHIMTYDVKWRHLRDIWLLKIKSNQIKSNQDSLFPPKWRFYKEWLEAWIGGRTERRLLTPLSQLVTDTIIASESLFWSALGLCRVVLHRRMAIWGWDKRERKKKENINTIQASSSESIMRHWSCSGAIIPHLSLIDVLAIFSWSITL